jgi:CAP12/Pycsar effector protein, TIR domain
MQRQIFVGSSSEALESARHICEVLSRDPGIRCVEWREIFQPGFLTFEALETMLLRCCGAVFVASPDDAITIRDRALKSPRANIMLEFGLVAGRLGRHNIALCLYGGAELPSDLQGLTVISMDLPGQAFNPAFRQQAEQHLLTWSSRLVATVERVPRTEIVHGYTGRWEFEISLKTWRGLPVSPGYVQVKGVLDLFLPANGQSGRGQAHGDLYFKIVSTNSEMYQGEYRIAHEVTNAACAKDGSLMLNSADFALQKVNSVGLIPSQLTGWDFSPEPWTAKWTLMPDAEPMTLQGEVHTEGPTISQGQVKMRKTFGDAALDSASIHSSEIEKP